MNTTIQSITKVLLSLLAIVTLPMLPVCPEMEIWSDGTHFRYLVKDWHTDYIDGRVSLKQQADIIWAAQQPKAHDVFVLAEDNHVYSGTNAKIQTIFDKYYSKSLSQAIAREQASNKIDKAKAINSNEILEVCPLMHLITACKNYNITSCSIDCCQAEDCFRKNKKIQIKISQEEVINSLLEHFVEVQNSLSKAAQAFFTQHLEQLKKISSQQNMDDEQFIQSCSKIRDDLVNAKTAHKLKEWNTIKHGFICEGAAHIDGTDGQTKEIKNCLKALGYKCIKRIGNPNLWNLAESVKTHQKMLAHALDLRKIFQEIFALDIAIKSQEQQKKLESKAKAIYPLKQRSSDMSFLQSSQGQKYLKETAAMTDDAPQATATTLAFTAAHTNPMYAQPPAPAAPAPAIPAFPLAQHPAPFVASRPVLLHQTAADRSTPMQD